MNKILTPINIGALELGHRIVGVDTPLPDDAPGANRATTPVPPGGAPVPVAGALLIGVSFSVSPGGGGHAAPYPFGGREPVGPLRRAAARLQGQGALVVASLSHLGRLAHSSWTGRRPDGPGALPAPCPVRDADGAWVPAEAPLALDAGGIDRLIGDFAAAARIMLAAGFDAVEIDAGGGHLVDQFLGDGVNQRSDRYGGSVENRTQILFELVEAIGGVFPRERIGVRLSPFSRANAMADSDPAAHFAEVLRGLNEQEIAYVHLGAPAGTASPAAGAPLFPARADDLFRAAFRSALIVSGPLGFDWAAEAVARRFADAVGFRTDPGDAAGPAGT